MDLPLIEWVTHQSGPGRIPYDGKAVGRMNSALPNQPCRVEFIRPTVFHPQSDRRVEFIRPAVFYPGRRAAVISVSKG